MRYRIIILLWIVYLIFSLLFSTIKLTDNKLLKKTAGIDYAYLEELPSETENETLLPYYDEVSYLAIDKNEFGGTKVYANNTYYEELGIIPPKENEYYGNSDTQGLERLGPGPYIDITKNMSYFNLDNYKDNPLSHFTKFYYKSEDKEKMYAIEQQVGQEGAGAITFTYTPYRISFRTKIFFYSVNIFFLLLMLMFLFVDINLYSKEIAISKMLGYKSIYIIKNNIIKQLLYSLIYIIPLIIPLFLIYYDSSPESFIFLNLIIHIVIKIYIITNIVYLGAFIYVSSKIKVVETLKGKQNFEIINIISISTNIVSKIFMILIISALIAPSYQLYRSFNQYGKYIKNNEDLVPVNIYEEMNANQNDISSFSDLYKTYNDEGAVLNTVDSGTYYTDNTIYVKDAFGEEADQFMITNNNYLNLIGFSKDLKSDKNYVLIPSTMQSSTSSILSDVESEYEIQNYEQEYYEPEEIYTYSPLSLSDSIGYIYSPIMLVLNDASNVQIGPYIMEHVYYENQSDANTTSHLTYEFTIFYNNIKKLAIIMSILCILFVSVILISTYYMINSYLQTNCKEISVKRILGYSRFEIYKTFYILDFICYIFGSVFIFQAVKMFSIPLWFVIIFIGIMILLNEFGRRVMIRKVEKNKIVNVLKGEV